MVDTPRAGGDMLAGMVAITTLRQAAQVADVTPSTLRGWVDKG